MNAKLRPLMFAAVLIPQDAPLAKRLEILGRHLSPKPGKSLEVEQTQLRDVAAVTKHPGKLYGTIRISPPKGQCFVVTTHIERPDITICQPTWVKWLLEDIDREKGTISWNIKTAPNDFGTPISWPTPYAIGKVLPLESQLHTKNGSPVFFKSCIAALERTNERPRKITLTTFDNKKWLIRFPEKDMPLPRLMTEDEVTALAKKAEEEAAAKKAAEAEQGGHGGGHEEGKAEPAPEPVKEEPEDPFNPKPKPAQIDAPEAWTINSRRGYHMNVGNFITDGSMPPGKKGSCRYAYDFVKGDYSRGHIECHDADQYSYIYVIVPCMAPIVPK